MVPLENPLIGLPSRSAAGVIGCRDGRGGDSMAAGRTRLACSFGTSFAGPLSDTISDGVPKSAKIRSISANTDEVVSDFRGATHGHLL